MINQPKVIKVSNTETIVRGTKKCLNCRNKWALPFSDFCFGCGKKAHIKKLKKEAEKFWERYI